MHVYIAPEECRAARQLLNWTAQTLSDQSGVSLRAISHFETGQRELRSANMQAVIAAFERHGVEFTKTKKRIGMTAPKPEGDGEAGAE
jgi:transcriptional regulator with XRE-family HTH domain